MFHRKGAKSAKVIFLVYRRGAETQSFLGGTHNLYSVCKELNQSTMICPAVVSIAAIGHTA